METWFARRPVRDLRPGDHAWLAFRDRTEQEHVIGDFVHDGLSGTDRVVYITDARPRELPGMVTRYLTDPGPYTATGQLQIVSPRVACDADGRFDPDRLLDAVDAEIGKAFAAGYRGLRVTGDMTWALRQPGGYERVLGCERRMDATIAASTLVTAICQFRLGRHCCSPRQLSALKDAHEVLVEANPEFEDGVLRITRTFAPPGLRLAGELDGARHAAFAETLASIVDTDRDVHLDLSGLRFIDLGALHLLTAFANRRRGGGRLLLDNLPPEPAALIDMVGWRRLPGLARGETYEAGLHSEQGAPS